MKKRIILLLLIITFSASAQTQIKSKLIDSSNNPIAFATIYIPETKRSTLSNESGDFYILIEPETDKTLLISHLSYQSAQIKITSNFPEKIILKDSSLQLQEVILGNPLTGYDIALKVAENLKENHDTDPAYYEYFTRIASYSEDWKTINLVQEYYGKLKHTEGHNTKANIKKSRAIPYNNLGEKLYKTETTMSLWGIRTDNLLLYLPNFLKKRKLKRYDITLEGSTIINGIDCYVLKYTDNDGKYLDDMKATAYVDKETSGIVKLITRNYQTQTGNYLERNFVNIKNKWVLSIATEKSHTKRLTTTLYNYLINEKDYADEDFGKTTFNEKIEKYDKNPNDSFWDNYQHIPLPGN